MEELEAAWALQFGRRRCRTRDGSGHREDAEERMGKGASLLLHSLPPCSTASALGTGSLGSIKGPSVSKEGTEMGSRSGEPGISPKHSQMWKMAEREGSDMPDLGKQNGESTDSTSTPVVERECAEIPLWPAEGKRAGAEAAPLHSRATRGSLTSPMCP